MRRALLLVGSVLATVALVLSGCGTPATPGQAGTAGSAGTAAGAGAGRLAPSEPTSGLAVVRLDDLPDQAVETLALIAAGGPFPYAKDGAVFGNRERILPPQQSGFYREYTVQKPGEPDRGPWRIVAGADGSRFWTEDHYASFEEVVQ